MKRLIYIAGEGHSGSTATDFLLGRFLGRSCGQLVELGQALNEDGTLDAEAATNAGLNTWRGFLSGASLQDRKDFRWMFDEILHERKIFGYLISPRARRAFAGRFDRSIVSIYEHCSSDTIIDSSKNATRALGILHSQVCDIYVIHLVRSPIGFVTSVAKREVSGRTAIGQLFWLMHWLAKNTFAYMLSWYFGRKYLRLEYSALFSDPQNALSPLFNLLGLHLSQQEFAQIYGETRMEPETVGGNRIRNEGPLKLQYKPIAESELRHVHVSTLLLGKLLELIVMRRRARSLSPA